MCAIHYTPKASPLHTTLYGKYTFLVSQEGPDPSANDYWSQIGGKVSFTLAKDLVHLDSLSSSKSSAQLCCPGLINTSRCHCLCMLSRLTPWQPLWPSEPMWSSSYLESGNGNMGKKERMCDVSHYSSRKTVEDKWRRIKRISAWHKKRS